MNAKEFYFYELCTFGSTDVLKLTSALRKCFIMPKAV
jgi:hypothetical protein